MKKAIILLALFLFNFVALSQRATPLQYLYMMKSFKPTTQKVGILCELDKNPGIVDKLQRSAFSAGIKIFIADVKELKDVSQKFAELMKNGVDFIWIIDEKDVSAHPIAREYIFKNSLLNKIPVAVPDPELVKEGGLFSLEVSGEEIKVFVNNKIANALQINIPENYKERVQYVAN
ncbi:ABC transporter substrate binding protein [Candidatus Chrysopegis kryptomonas]|jgi:ABC-type uncharacterized transport system substrate-binding protein|uniref:ABC transporter substrate binding protein n=1 Tax=Candidatus Chryseopegocella kryptomonas TaxID=1633643 RepID=A0A0P1MRG8_9BACT|nr:ABC transporter substrate binding protein [Candidatus Chrysopegis kryptomonas]CUS98318.1 ABC transporter substrate binding protein [Candidatus Chrysopegis kryptomonas]